MQYSFGYVLKNHDTSLQLLRFVYGLLVRFSKLPTLDWRNDKQNQTAQSNCRSGQTETVLVRLRQVKETPYKIDILRKATIVITKTLLPAIGGPISDAIPWNSSSSPKALVRRSSPNKSTRMTEVSPT